jgi:hypothetical protein
MPACDNNLRYFNFHFPLARGTGREYLPRIVELRDRLPLLSNFDFLVDA